MIVRKIYNSWFKINDKIRFIFVGGFNTAISYMIFVILVLIFGKNHHQICVIGQWILSSFISFLNQKFFVFNTKGNYVKEYIKCCSTWVVGFILNIVILEIMIKFILKNIYFAQLLALTIVPIITYILLKHFAFKVKS